MTGLQKFIKYVAIAFGIYLSITIVLVFLGIARGFVGASRTEFNSFIEGQEEYDVEDISKEFENIKKLEINLDKTELIIKNGDTLKVEGTNIPKKMELKQDGQNLKISDENISSNLTNEKIITVYIPENQKFDEIDLEIEYEAVDIETLNATNLNMDFYSNDCKIDKLITDNLEIDNEYANIDIYNCEVKKFKLDTDSGYENIHVKIAESANMDIKYSDTNIKLIGNQEDYQIINKNYLGTTYVDGEEVASRNETIGTANIKINLDIKSADTYIDFEENANENYL